MATCSGSHLKQKVYIARALAQESELFLFDEPTGNLDLKHQLEVLEITRNLTKSRGASMIVALHDPNLAYAHSDTVIVLNKGRVHAFGEPVDVLTPETIRDVYGVEAMIVESDYGGAHSAAKDENLIFEVSEVSKRAPSFITEGTEAPGGRTEDDIIKTGLKPLLKNLCAPSGTSESSVMRLGGLSKPLRPMHHKWMNAR
jgi:ABC-type multidrug transport system ATPase subunit